jgi:hypothetical protein
MEEHELYNVQTQVSWTYALIGLALVIYNVHFKGTIWRDLKWTETAKAWVAAVFRIF